MIVTIKYMYISWATCYRVIVIFLETSRKMANVASVRTRTVHARNALPCPPCTAVITERQEERKKGREEDDNR